MENEIRRPVGGYNGKYEVSNLGDIYSKRGAVSKKMKPQISHCGYLRVMLYSGGQPKWASIHRLVAETFCYKPEGCEVVNHIDANPQNCAASNLEWVNQAMNIAHSRKLGNQNKDKPVRITSPTGEVRHFGNMREASRVMFGGPYVLRSQFRRRGPCFMYHGHVVEVI